jgi:hypothetical protein
VRQPNRSEYLAQEAKIKAEQEAAKVLAVQQRNKHNATTTTTSETTETTGAAWAVSAAAQSLRSATGKARQAAKLVGIKDPGAASAQSRLRHPLASGVSSYGSATRMLVFQRGDADAGSNALTADTLRHADAVLRKWSGDSLAHSIVLQSQIR